MTREAKVGLMMVAILVGVFGFLLYKRMHRPPEMLAEQVSKEETRNIAERASDGFADDASLAVPFEQPTPPVKKRARSRIVREVESAAENVERVAEEVIEEMNPFASEPKKREKPRMPVELSSVDDDFGAVQATPRESRSQSSRTRAIEPAVDSFDAPVERRSTASETRLLPPRSIPTDEVSVAEDPFSSDRSTSNVQPVQFEDSPRRERSVPIPNDTGDRNTSGEFRSTSSNFDSDTQLSEPRRVRESDASFEPANREKRRAAPTTILDDRSTAETGRSSRNSVDGQTYVIQPNDNLWTISQRRYGAGRYYKALAVHNQQTITDPKMMKPGVTISTPDAFVLEQRYADVIPKAAPVESVSSVKSTQSRKPSEIEPAGYFVDSDGIPMYRVGEQDTLTGIAKSHLGRTSRWVQILEMNRNVLRDGNELKIGTLLRLPADASRVQMVGTSRDLR